MNFHGLTQSIRRNNCEIAQYALLILLAFTILWKGGKSLESTWLLLGVSWLISLLHWMKPSRERVPLQLGVALFCFVTATILSYVYSTAANYGLDEVLATSALALIFLWVVRIDTDHRALFVARFSKMVTLLTLTASIIGIIVYVLQPVDRLVGTFFDFRFHTDYWPNAFGDFLLLAWPFCFLTYDRWSRSMMDAKRRGMLIALFGFLLGVLFLTYSRGSIIALALQLGLILFIALHKGIQIHRKNLLAGSAAVLCTGLITFSLVNGLRSNFYPVQSASEKVTFEADEGTSSVSERQMFWQQAWQLAWEKPLLGWGPYSFRFIQPRLQSAVLATSDHPHNVFLKYAVERGIAACIFFLIFIGSIGWHCIRAIRQPHRLHLLPVPHFTGDAQPVLHVLPLVSVVGVFAHSLIDYNLQFVGIALPLWITLGILAWGYPSVRRSLPVPIERTVEAAFITLMMILALVEAYFIMVSSLGRHAEAAGNSEKALGYYQSARYEWFSRDMHLSRAKILHETDRHAESKDALRAYFSGNQEDARAWKRRGDIALADGQSAEAAEFYDKAYRMNRFNDLGTLQGLLDALLAAKREHSIRERLPEFEKLLDQYATAIQANAHYIALSQNVEEYIAILGILASIDPEREPRYDVLRAAADRKAREERARIQSRPPGFLW